MSKLLLLTLAATAACTTLGPTPATTMGSARPAERPSIDAQAGFVPGHYLSESVRAEPEGTGIGQISALFEPDHVIGIPGLILGARLFGQDGDTPVEPMIGYRAAL